VEARPRHFIGAAILVAVLVAGIAYLYLTAAGGM
jgi:hypothetical protein